MLTPLILLDLPLISPLEDVLAVNAKGGKGLAIGVLTEIVGLRLCLFRGAADDLL